MKEIQRAITKIDQRIKYEKLEYDINSAAAKIFALSSGKIGKYEYLTDEKMLPPQQHRIIKYTKSTFLSLGYALEKQKKLLKSQEKNKENQWKPKEIKNICTSRDIKKDDDDADDDDDDDDDGISVVIMKDF